MMPINSYIYFLFKKYFRGSRCRGFIQSRVNQSISRLGKKNQSREIGEDKNSVERVIDDDDVSSNCDVNRTTALYNRRAGATLDQLHSSSASHVVRRWVFSCV